MVSGPLLLQVAINGLLIGGVYGIAALGLGLIWGVMKIVNLAHGVFIMLGAYISYFAFTFLGLHPFLSLLISLPLGLAGGFLVYRFLINRILVATVSELEMEMMTLLFTFALSILIYGAALNAWGADLRGIPVAFPTWSPLGIDLPTSRLAAFVAALGLGGTLYLFLQRTYMGKAIRAVTQSRSASMLVGIKPETIFGIAFSIGIAYALIAGVVASFTTAITPYLGVLYLLKCFTVVALAGMGNPLGVFASGLILGLAESVTTLFASYALSPAVAFILLILILILRPQGLFEAMR